MATFPTEALTVPQKVLEVVPVGVDAEIDTEPDTVVPYDGREGGRKEERIRPRMCRGGKGGSNGIKMAAWCTVCTVSTMPQLPYAC